VRFRGVQVIVVVPLFSCTFVTRWPFTSTPGRSDWITGTVSRRSYIESAFR
jgi:hypothetical protein